MLLIFEALRIHVHIVGKVTDITLYVMLLDNYQIYSKAPQEVKYNLMTISETLFHSSFATVRENLQMYLSEGSYNLLSSIIKLLHILHRNGMICCSWCQGCGRQDLLRCSITDQQVFNMNF